MTIYDLDPPTHWRGTREDYARHLAQRPMEIWDERFAAQVLAEAQRLRKLLKLSARDMSERLTGAGWPLTVNSVNGMLGKKGRLTVSVPQIIALARALEVAPIDLVFPPGLPRVDYDLRENVPRQTAVDRFTGAAGGSPHRSVSDQLADVLRRVSELERSEGEQDGEA